MQSKGKIIQVLKEALCKGWISKDEFLARNPEDCDPANLYCLFKVHKKHKNGQPPPVQPIISGSGSITENMGQYVEHHIKPLSNKHKSYLQDTPHFLRVIEAIRRGPKLPENSILVTADITGAYQNIPQDDGIECLKEELETRDNKTIPSEFISKLMELILKYNIFRFDKNLYQQKIGTAMGTKPAPSYANIYLAKRIDNEIEQIGHKYGQNGKSALLTFKRYLDDLFFVFNGSTKDLHRFFQEMNEIHPNLKFTISHTSILSEIQEDKCECDIKQSVAFLDTSCSLENGTIEVDLFRKKTDRNQYLMPESCHSNGIIKNIPYSLALRIIRICTKTDQRDNRLQELKILLLQRKYPEPLINRALDRARLVPRHKALRQRVKKQETSKRPIFALKYDPRLPSIPAIHAKHWRAMVSQDKYLNDVFPEPPLVAFRRQDNIRNVLIRSKVPPVPKRNSERQIKGTKKCGRSCIACPFISEEKIVKINNKQDWKIKRKHTCESYNVIYMIECSKERCKKRYIGETGRFLRSRLSDHRGYVSNKATDKATGDHFNLPGHSLSNMTVRVLEQVKIRDSSYRKEREKYFINLFDTYNNGLNRQK